MCGNLNRAQHVPVFLHHSYILKVVEGLSGLGQIYVCVHTVTYTREAGRGDLGAAGHTRCTHTHIQLGPLNTASVATGLNQHTPYLSERERSVQRELEDPENALLLYPWKSIVCTAIAIILPAHAMSGV